MSGKLTSFFVSAVSTATKGTASFFLQLFILCYAMVFFLQEKTSVLTQVLGYSGLPLEVQSKLVDRTTAVSRATIKGTLVIGVVQGVLGAVGFAIAGVSGAAFWGAVIAILGVIPGVGPTIVWIPAVIFLAATGDFYPAIGLALWCALVVSTIDNFLRPVLVGRDAGMNDLMVLVGTLGGLAMFGATGLIIGPVIAGLFVTIWEVVQDYTADAASDQDIETG